MGNVIHIFGAAGSGTTTLGMKICQELGYKLMDTDDYFWMPTDPKFTLKRPREERIDLSDGIYVLNIDGYVGESVRKEIDYAKRHGKEVIYHCN